MGKLNVGYSLFEEKIRDVEGVRVAYKDGNEEIYWDDEYDQFFYKYNFYTIKNIEIEEDDIFMNDMYITMNDGEMVKLEII